MQNELAAAYESRNDRLFIANRCGGFCETRTHGDHLIFNWRMGTQPHSVHILNYESWWSWERSTLEGILADFFKVDRRAVKETLDSVDLSSATA